VKAIPPKPKGVGYPCHIYMKIIKSKKDKIELEFFDEDERKDFEKILLEINNWRIKKEHDLR